MSHCDTSQVKSTMFFTFPKPKFIQRVFRGLRELRYVLHELLEKQMEFAVPGRWRPNINPMLDPLFQGPVAVVSQGKRNNEID